MKLNVTSASVTRVFDFLTFLLFIIFKQISKHVKEFIHILEYIIVTKHVYICTVAQLRNWAHVYCLLFNTIYLQDPLIYLITHTYWCYGHPCVVENTNVTYPVFVLMFNYSCTTSFSKLKIG